MFGYSFLPPLGGPSVGAHFRPPQMPSAFLPSPQHSMLAFGQQGQGGGMGGLLNSPVSQLGLLALLHGAGGHTVLPGTLGSYAMPGSSYGAGLIGPGGLLGGGV